MTAALHAAWSVTDEAANVGARLSRVLTAADDDEALAQAAVTCLEILAAFVEADRALVGMFDEHEQVTERFSWSRPGVQAREIPIGAGVDEFAGASMGFLRIGRAVAIGNSAAIELSLTERQTAERTGEMPAAAMLIPVLVAGDLAGVLVLESTEATRTWTRQFVAEVETCAELVVRMLGRTRERQALAVANARARRIADHLPDGLAMLTPEGAIAWVSPSFSAMTGRLAKELERLPLSELVSPPDRGQLLECLASLDPGLDAQCTLRLTDPTGQWRWSELSLRLASEPGVPDEVVVTVRDTHDRHLRELRLVAESDLDPLTRVANRWAFGRFVDELASARSLVMVAFCDIDDFKRTNDELGHGAGDEVLAQVATAISRAVRSRDMVARIGGDEFVVILVDPGDKAAMLGDRLVRGVRNASAGGRLVSVSVGVCGPGPSALARSMVRRADEAMYQAKNAGKDGWVRGELPAG